MLKKFTSFATMCLLVWHSSSAYERYLRVPHQISAILDAHVDDLIDIIDACEDHTCEIYERVKCFSWLPDYYVKYDATRRIDGAAEIAKCIEEYGLNLLKVPQKYIYQIKGRGRAINNHNYLLVVPVIHRLPRKPLNLEQTKQLLIIGRYAQFTDWRGNLLFTDSNTLTFIDTGYTVKKRADRELIKIYLHSIHNLVRDIKLDNDAYNYIVNNLNDLKEEVSQELAQDIQKLLDQLPELRKPLKPAPPQS